MFSRERGYMYYERKGTGHGTQEGSVMYPLQFHFDKKPRCKSHQIREWSFGNIYIYTYIYFIFVYVTSIMPAKFDFEVLQIKGPKVHKFRTAIFPEVLIYKVTEEDMLKVPGGKFQAHHDRVDFGHGLGFL